MYFVLPPIPCRPDYLFTFNLQDIFMSFVTKINLFNEQPITAF